MAGYTPAALFTAVGKLPYQIATVRQDVKTENCAE